ncbi:MAG: HNH endonuclease [Pyrinomonadaceae bacterium]|nr:HNH endonuclease [Pyrinomonadaceae bacterium]
MKEDIPLRDHLTVGCCVKNCSSPKKALNLCNKHYEKLKKYGNPLCGKEMEKGFVGKRYIDKYGYVFVYMPTENKAKKCEYISEHRLLMEQKLGRKLLPKETVHHINGNRQDNRPENLELWLYPQKPGQRVSDLIKWAKEILATYGNEEEKI